MEMTDWLNENKGKILILIDDKGLRWEGKLENVFADFFQIYELRKKTSKVFKISSIKNFEVKNGN
jgi:hypothetical protein